MTANETGTSRNEYMVHVRRLRKGRREKRLCDRDWNGYVSATNNFFFI